MQKNLNDNYNDNNNHKVPPFVAIIKKLISQIINHYHYEDFLAPSFSTKC